MLRARIVALVALSSLALAGPGCSFFVLDRVPPDFEAEDDLACTDSFATPALDAVVAVLSGVLAVNLYAAGDGDEPEASLQAGAAVSAGVGAVFLAGTAYGVVQVHRCRDAKSRSGLRGPPSVDRWDEKAPGSLGAACRDDGSCDGELICDQPMQTCVPIVPTDEDM